MPNVINTRYGGGDVTTGASIEPFDIPDDGFFDKIVSRRLAPRRGGVGAKSTSTARPYVPPPQERNQRPPWQDDLDRLKAFDQYESTLKSAAMRPTGLGPGMIPGMAVDPRLLPSRMLPSGSTFSSGGLSDTQVARLNPEIRRQMDEDDQDRQEAAARANPAPSFEERFFQQFGRMPSAHERAAFMPRT